MNPTIRQLQSAVVLATIVAVAAACQPAAPALPDVARTAALTEIVNRVEARPSDQTPWTAAYDGQTLTTGGEVQTFATSTARVDFAAGTIVRLAPLTLFTLADLEPSAGSTLLQLRLALGKVFVVLAAGDPHALEVQTPVGVATVRGSLMSAAYDPSQNSLIVACLTGHCAIRNAAGEVELTDGQEAESRDPAVAPSPARPLSSANLQDFTQLPEAASALPVLAATASAVPTRPLPAATGEPGTAVPAARSTPAGTLPSVTDHVTPLPTAAGSATLSNVATRVALPTLAVTEPQGTQVDIEVPDTPAPPTGDAGTGGRVSLPPINCAGAACEAYCGQIPPPADCDAFAEALIAQGVNFDAFRVCVLAGGDMQTCADANVRPAP